MNTYDETYINEMKEAMMTLHEACKHNEYWNHCHLCPFDKYCDVILEQYYLTPDENGFINFDEEE